MKLLPQLFKLDIKERVRTFRVEYDDVHYITYSGLDGGKQNGTTTYPEAKGGRTAAEQVLKEAEAKHRKKYERELYSYDLTKPHPLAYIKPMAALDYTKVGHRADWLKSSWVTQPKLNGVRCIAQLVGEEVKLTSRGGKQYHVPHIEEAFLSLYKHQNLFKPVFDGELYIHGVELGDVTHAVAHGDSSLVFKLFDMVDTKVVFSERYSSIERFSGDSIQVVPCTPVLDELDLLEKHRIYVREGYEGAMLRDINSKYTPGRRTPGMFKYKTFQDSEFEVVGVTEDKSGGVILQLVTESGIKFSSRPMGTDAYRRELLESAVAIIGKMATVKYSSLLKSGVPEFNRCIAIRDYE